MILFVYGFDLFLCMVRDDGEGMLILSLRTILCVSDLVAYAVFRKKDKTIRVHIELSNKRTSVIDMTLKAVVKARQYHPCPLLQRKEVRYDGKMKSYNHMRQGGRKAIITLGSRFHACIFDMTCLTSETSILDHCFGLNI